MFDSCLKFYYPRLAEYINMVYISLLFSDKFSCVISINSIVSKAAWKTVQILIRWLPQKPSDLELHCFLKRIYSSSAEQGLSYSAESCRNLTCLFLQTVQSADSKQLLCSIFWWSESRI